MIWLLVALIIGLLFGWGTGYPLGKQVGFFKGQVDERRKWEALYTSAMVKASSEHESRKCPKCLDDPDYNKWQNDKGFPPCDACSKWAEEV